MNTEPSSQSSTKAEKSNGRSQKEDGADSRRYMTSLLFVCLIGVVPGALSGGLVTALLSSSKSSASPPTNDSTANRRVCTTNDCKVLAQWLRVKVDQKVDPCHDFYQFVCDDYKGAISLLKITSEIPRIAKSAAGATTVPATGQTAWQKATALFQACLTMVDSKRDETKELAAWMTSLGLDLNNLTSSEPFDPMDMLVRCSIDFGIPVLLTFSFKNVILVNNKRLIMLELNDAYYTWTVYKTEALISSIMKLQTFYERTLQKYGVDKSRLAVIVSEIMKYEIEALKVFASVRRMQGVSIYVRGPIEGMGEVTKPAITGEMWAGSIAKYTKNTYQGSDIIDYQKRVPLFLSKALESKDVGSHGMRCCIAWGLLRTLINYTDPNLLVNDENPEDVCYKHANRLMGYAITSRFYHSVISKNTLNEVREIASNIRKAYQAAFQSSSWMTGSVRETALKKIKKMRHHFGAVDATYVEKYYASFPDMPTDRFFKAWREAAAAAIHQAWADATMLLNAETSANAYYSRHFNTMVISASTLLPNILFTEGPSAFNYGSLGTIMGHEMMHGYDVDSSKYDEDAKRRPWFLPESKKHYVNKTLCLRHLHKDVLRPRQEVLNDTVDSENLGDLGGTTMAYSAFTSLPPSKRDITLPGVAMTANQLFFVGHCTPWCEKRTTNSPPWLAGYDRYPPGRSRCIVPLMNMPEFSDAFHCKQGSYMNPPNKCMFWT